MSCSPVGWGLVTRSKVDKLLELLKELSLLLRHVFEFFQLAFSSLNTTWSVSRVFFLLKLRWVDLLESNKRGVDVFALLGLDIGNQSLLPFSHFCELYMVH